MQVYPAASLINYIADTTPVFFIDPKPAIHASAYKNLTVIEEKAVSGMKKFIELIPF